MREAWILYIILKVKGFFRCYLLPYFAALSLCLPLARLHFLLPPLLVLFPFRWVFGVRCPGLGLGVGALVLYLYLGRRDPVVE